MNDASDTPPAPEDQLGLRERKKRATRIAMHRAALELVAADGLSESRRAVAALREQPRQDLLDGVAELLRAHRDSGADVLTILPNRPQAVLARLSPEGVEALLRAVQEMLTNVRRHAPGQAVTLEMRFADASLDSGAGH